MPKHDERDREKDREREAHERAKDATTEPNHPRTTTGKVTAPKFGSAVSGGGDVEPGLKKS